MDDELQKTPDEKSHTKAVIIHFIIGVVVITGCIFAGYKIFHRNDHPPAPASSIESVSVKDPMINYKELPKAADMNAFIVATKNLSYKLDTGIVKGDYHSEYQKIYTIARKVADKYPNAPTNEYMQNILFNLTDIDNVWNTESKYHDNDMWIRESSLPTNNNFTTRHNTAGYKRISVHGETYISVHSAIESMMTDLSKSIDTNISEIVNLYE